MHCIAHISDLHFGTEDPGLVAGLLQDLAREAPSLCIISGDLTQRARTSQFQLARSFIGRLGVRTLVVPGNHDIPLFDLFGRFCFPLYRYKKFICRELNSYFEDDGLAALGLNTVRSLTWKSGRISHEQMRLIPETIGRAGKSKFKILVTHHPFIPPPGELQAGIDMVGRADEALAVIDQSGVDLLLAGHLHHGYSGDVRRFYPATTRSIIVVQAGTAISRRIRTEPNAYNLLRLDKNIIKIEVRVWSGSQFEKTVEAVYQLHELEWRLI